MVRYELFQQFTYLTVTGYETVVFLLRVTL